MTPHMLAPKIQLVVYTTYTTHLQRYPLNMGKEEKTSHQSTFAANDVSHLFYDDPRKWNFRRLSDQLVVVVVVVVVVASQLVYRVTT